MTEARLKEFFVYIGAYTSRQSKGIYLGRFDAASGTLEMIGLAAELPDPTFIAIHPNGRFLYTVSKIAGSGGGHEEYLNAFAIHRETGRLTFLNRQPSGGASPCHVSLDSGGRCALVANYGSGTSAIFPIGNDGRLGEARDVIQHHGSSVVPKRQEGPHAHSITPSPDDRFALAADLGTDRIIVYRLDAAKARITPNDPPWVALKPSSGPRHLAFHPRQPLVYVINELASTMTVLDWDPSRGVLHEAQTLSTLPPDFHGTSWCADVHAAPSGRFLYGSNRGHDSITIYRIEEPAGTLSVVGYQPVLGKWPRNFTLDPSGDWLLAANAGTGEGRPLPPEQLDPGDENVVVFRVDPATGRLSPTGHSIPVSVPVCVKLLPCL